MSEQAGTVRMPNPPSVLAPALPFDMKPRAKEAAADRQLQQFVGSATRIKDRGRVNTCREAFGDRYDALRKHAGAIKQHTLDYLDWYLEEFIERARASGAQVHFAADAAEANAICLRIARKNSCTRCVKSKSMVTEETHLLPALQAAGIETVETDLGEFILQLDGDAPSHIVTPMIHKNRASVARAFVRELGAEYTEDPRELTMIAREHLRRKYRDADLGISGANFLVAETGTLVICTNEGNADFCVAAPGVHIAMVGIEKVIPRLADLSVFLKLLARSATAQPLTVYTSLITGPRKQGAGTEREHDGPEQVHIILVDNGRVELLRDESRELLRCIRCGACLNACPIYRKVGGGHAYGAVYSGPIGAVLTPLLKGLENYPDLPQASSLCGACFEACPVHIDIPRHLVRLRAKLVDTKQIEWQDRAIMRLWTKSMQWPGAYRLGSAVLRTLMRGVAEMQGSAGEKRWLKYAPGPLQGWTDIRDLPSPAAESFRAWWDARRETGGGDA
ncbi:MAG: lactate utilization protein [Pyrinomonadaceae bacterium]|nr:lactate utilization protein [Phycisphaerales bacterium]